MICNWSPRRARQLKYMRQRRSGGIPAKTPAMLAQASRDVNITWAQGDRSASNRLDNFCAELVPELGNEPRENPHASVWERRAAPVTPKGFFEAHGTSTK